MLVKEFITCAALFFILAIQLKAQGSKHRVLLSERIYFISGSAQVDNNYQTTLQKINKMQGEAPNRYIWIHAYTDSIGSIDYNENLSALRARNIEIALERIGVDTLKMDIRHYGPYNPTADNSTEKGRAENRRVAVYIVEPIDSNRIGSWAILRGQLVDAKTKKPAIGQLHITSLSGKDTISTDSQGYYFYRATDFNPTEVRAYVKGYFFVSKVCKPIFQDSLTTDFQLERAILGGKMMLNDLYFQMGTATLMPSSKAALEGLLTFLQLNETLIIEIGGHVNKPNEPPLAENTASFRLSKSRAEAVYNYLIEQGIAPNRLSYKGYGNWEMIHPDAETELQQQLNRRVEIKIVE
jgi:outer membrane protein OmpA-like peptidoglycan-associated protein